MLRDDARLTAAGTAPRPHAAQLLGDCVAAGLGVALAPGVVGDGIPVAGAPPLGYCLVTRRDDRPPVADALLETLAGRS
ncbi:MAG: hypothetical protein QOE86_1068 [Solirubrobacteraceae bacterium]|nr:hypothetical protein [Solirubrobacteraceae bacterium]